MRRKRRLCPATLRRIPSVKRIKYGLQDKIKTWFTFPAAWKPQVAQVIAEVLYESCQRRGIPATIVRAEALERPEAMWFSWSCTIDTSFGELPVWKRFEPEPLRAACHTLLNQQVSSSTFTQHRALAEASCDRGPRPHRRAGRRIIDAVFRRVGYRPILGSHGARRCIIEMEEHKEEKTQ